MHILLIEDNPLVAISVSHGLAARGHSVTHAASGREGLAQARANGLEAVVLDLILPDMAGEDVLRELRQGQPHLPLVVLSAKQATSDKVACLNAGADDYLTKPFSMDELAARLAAVRRRKGDEVTTLTSEGLTIDLVQRHVEVDGRRIALKEREFGLLRCFMEHPGKVLGRELLLKQVWGYDFVPESNVLNVHICLLREKLDGSGKAHYIHSVRGKGFIFRREEAAGQGPGAGIGTE